ncbi:MAG: iron chelate uptake ABC transporter family permease subunit, partial [Propionibacteriaceae bacterium]|nr:iron chelate uptake ABC transporter family permease subunit [Propionibacteriaceae bacterium]
MATAVPAVVPGVAVVRRPVRARALWLIALLVALLAVAVTSIAIGARDVAWSDVWAAFSGVADTFETAAVTKRIPRTLLAVLVGAALGLSGAVMQGVTRNPLA